MRESTRIQLEKWVSGESVHNTEIDECCPDFSCCKSGIKTDKATKIKFYEAVMSGDEDTKMSMLFGFLGELMAITENTHRVYIAGSPDQKQETKGE